MHASKVRGMNPVHSLQRLSFSNFTKDFGTNQMKKLIIAFTLFAYTTFGQTIPTYLPSSGLLGWWPFNSNANDESGYTNHGTSTGASLTLDRTGQANKAYYFNGNSYIRNSFTTATVTNNFTMALWAEPQDTIVLRSVNSYTDRVSIGKGAAFHPTHGSCFSAFNASGAGIYVGVNGIHVYEHSHNYLRCALSYPVTLTGWHSIVVVYTNKVPTLYLDGVAVATGQAGSINVHLSFGYDNNVLGDYSGSGFGSAFSSPTVSRSKYKGKLDDIAVWNRTLTPTEIYDMVFPCADSISQQPSNVVLSQGQNQASFTCKSTNPTATYQWQQNSGIGWVNLSNFGVYQGTTTDSLSLTGVSSAQNNFAFRCLVSGCEQDTSDFALLLIAPCSDSITQQPSNFTASYSVAWANFKCKSSNPSAQFQWQEHNGSGWLNLNSSGIYIGANTDSLVLSGLTPSMQNYAYRCLVSSCTNFTSDSAILNINDVVGIDEREHVLLHPNPTTGELHFESDRPGYVSVFDVHGRLVMSEFCELNTLDVSTLTPGVYLIELTANSVRVRKQFVKL